MYTIEEIRTWSTSRIREEIKDQRRWVREAKKDGFGDFSASNEYLGRLYQVLNERS